MTVREILKMGDPRLLRVAPPVPAFDTPELHALIADMFDTMEAANGAGLAAPQIGVDLQLVVFGFGRIERYPEAPPVPRTVLINRWTSAWWTAGRVAFRCPVCVAPCRATPASDTPASTPWASRLNARPTASTPAWCSMNVTTSSGACTPRAWWT